MSVNGHKTRQEFNDEAEAIIQAINDVTRQPDSEDTCGKLRALWDNHIRPILEEWLDHEEDGSLDLTPNKVKQLLAILEKRTFGSGCLEGWSRSPERIRSTDLEEPRQDLFEAVIKQDRHEVWDIFDYLRQKYERYLNGARSEHYTEVDNLVRENTPDRLGGVGDEVRREVEQAIDNVACVAAPTERDLEQAIQSAIDDSGGVPSDISTTTDARGDLVACILLEKYADENF